MGLDKTHIDGFTLHDIIFNIMLMIPGSTLRLINGLTLNRTLTLTDQGSMAES